MRKLTLAMQMTLDGFVVGPNGEMDWIISSPEEWEEMFKDLNSVDTMLVGAGMYPGYSGYWRSVMSNKNSDKDERTYARIADSTTHIVFSQNMKDVDWRNTRIGRDVKREVTSLKQSKGGNIFAWGGASLAHSLIAAGLVDEFRITLNPILLGDGTRLFANGTARQKLSLREEKQFSTGVMLLRYAL